MIINKRVYVVISATLVLVAVLFAIRTLRPDQQNQEPTNGNDSITEDQINKLPDITHFKDSPSDQFLVDMNTVAAGHPYKGERALDPHSGAHIHFGDGFKSWPKGADVAHNYPPIYAVADGIVKMVEYSFPVAPNDRYGVVVSISRIGQKVVNFGYSIEPMIKEPSAGFYRQFITVKEGDEVKKGQVIAYMYLPKEANGTHIHFGLTIDNQFKAPAIFTQTVVQAFHDRWDNFGLDRQQVAIPVCMGWKLNPEENPFESKTIDCL